jgi:hypothetical protein
MGESKTTTKKRARRSTQVSRNLEEARQRLANQLAEEREREERIKQALRGYMAAGEKIAGAELACEEKVAELEKRIARLREQSREKVAGAHTEQARAALTMHEAGRTVEQVAELVMASQKEARRLIAAGRDADTGKGEEAAGTATQPKEVSPGPADEQRPAATPSGVATRGTGAAVSGEQRDLGGVDPHQDGPYAGFVPAVAHGGGEGA